MQASFNSSGQWIFKKRSWLLFTKKETYQVNIDIKKHEFITSVEKLKRINHFAAVKRDIVSYYDCIVESCRKFQTLYVVHTKAATGGVL